MRTLTLIFFQSLQCFKLGCSRWFLLGDQSTGIWSQHFHTLSRQWKQRILRVSFCQIAVCNLWRFTLCSIFWHTVVSLLVLACAFSQSYAGCCSCVRLVVYCSCLFYTEDWMSWAVTRPFSSARSHRLAVQHYTQEFLHAFRKYSTHFFWLRIKVLNHTES